MFLRQTFPVWMAVAVVESPSVSCLVLVPSIKSPRSAVWHGSSRRQAIVRLHKINNHNGEATDDRDHDDDDISFYRDLGQAKKSKLGGRIPQEQLDELATPAEAEFLAAMDQVRNEFQRVKERLGSEGAVEFFRRKIQKAENGTAQMGDDDDNNNNNNNNKRGESHEGSPNGDERH